MEEDKKREYELLKAHLRKISTPTGIGYSGDPTMSKENTEWLINLIEEQSEVIDLMSEDLNKYTGFNYGQDTGMMIGPYMNTNTLEIKNYYFKKAREEK